MRFLLLFLLSSFSLRANAEESPAAPPPAEAVFEKAEAFLSSPKAAEKKRGFRLIKERAEAGVERAEVRLAELYHQGLGVEKDKGAAWGWYEKAAAQGSAKALKLLSLRYRLGCDGTKKNPARAEDLLKKARAYVSKENYASIEETAQATECPNP